MFIFFIDLEVPYFEECSFGYYEWFARKVDNTITITKVPILASFKKVRSDYEYELEIKYSPKFKDTDSYFSRYEAYELVKSYWDTNNHLDYMKIRVEEKEGSTIFLPYTKEDYKLEFYKSLEKLKLKLKLKNERIKKVKENKFNYDL